MCELPIDVPEAVLFGTHSTVAEASAFARRMTALGYYVHGHVSLGYCAEIAGLTEEEFVLFLGQNKVDVFQFESDDELLRDVANA